MSDNRHTSSLRRIGKSRKPRQLRRKSSQQSVDYETLEPRQLLAGDLGNTFNFDSQVFGANAGSPVNSSGGVGPAHIVEVTDNGLTIFDKATGAELVNKSLQDFWIDTGGAGAQADAELADSANNRNSRVLYDVDERRWFMVSITGVDISSALGTQTSVLLAVSRSSDPTQDWSTTLDFYDEDGDPETPAIPLRGGFRTNAQSAQSLGLSVDDNNLYVTVDEGNPFATDTTYVFNKFTDLVVPNADATNRSELAHGAGSLQWGLDTVGDEVGAFGLFVPRSGNQIVLVEANNPEAAGGVSLGAVDNIAVPAYDSPPPFVRQLFDSDLVNSDAQLTAHTVRNGDSMWAVHAIEGAAGTSALQWYEIDVVNKTILQTDVIQDDTDNFIYPSIAVTDSGQIAISYTITGVDRFPSHGVSLGFLNNGVTTIEDPLIIGEGESGYFDGRGNLWGRYLTSFVDVDDPETLDVDESEDIWFFGQRTDANNDGQTRVARLSLQGLSPEIQGDALDNTIVVRRSATNATDIEVEIDGALVGTFEEQFLFSITLNGMGGDDTFVIDTANGELDFEGGVNFVGDGDDQIDLRTDINTNWDVGIDGTGEARIGDDFPPPCADSHDDIVTFNLNFEEGSRWFDTTPFEDGTFGDALRSAVTNYFTDVIAPMFTGTFDVTIDLNDDETDAFASSQAFGQGFEEVNGLNVIVGSPWSILTGEGDRNGAASDGVINYNLGLDLYGGDRQALLDNVGGGLTWFEMKNILGMESFIENATPTDNDIGNRHTATLYDVQLFDVNNAPLIEGYDPATNTFVVANYTTTDDWANDNSGLFFRGFEEDGTPTELSLNSNLELINFDVLASSLAGSSRDGDFNLPNAQDRAFLRGLGYELNPEAVPNPDSGFSVNFEGLDLIFAGDGVDHFCINSSNVDIEIHGGDGDDIFNVVGLGVGAVDLQGEVGDDTYQVAFSSAGAITITDSPDDENDRLIGVGTNEDDIFIIDEQGVDVNGGVFAQTGVENFQFDGRDGDDIFDIRTSVSNDKFIDGGEGNDTFFYNDRGLGGNQDQLEVLVDDPNLDPEIRLRLNLTNTITDSYSTDSIENLRVDGTFLVNGINGTPTVAGGLNLIGDGDDRLIVDSTLDAGWLVDGDGAGTVTMDVEPMTFVGLDRIEGTRGNNTFDLNNTNTNLNIQTFEGEDVFNINNVGTGVIDIFSGDSNDLFTIVNSGGAVNLFGEVGDDFYDVDFSNPGGLITIRDSINRENDSISAFGTDGNDHFIFDGSTTDVNGVLIDHLGIENVTYDGMDGDDLFEVRSSSGGDAKVISGGAGDDLFFVNDAGAGANGNVLEVSVANPSGAVNQVQLDISSFITDTFLADTIENLSVDGLYLFNGVNGTPTVAGGFNLLGDGDERLEIDSNVAAVWNIDGDGAGTVSMDVSPMTFMGLELIDGSHGVDTVTVANTGTNLEIRTREGNDVIDINNVGAGITTVRAGDGDDLMNVLRSGTNGVNLFGEAGDDTYTIDLNNPHGLITVRDSVNAENDTLNILGTAGDDLFVFDGGVVNANGVMVDIIGIENGGYDGLAGDDTFEVISSGNGGTGIRGGDGNDTFIVNDGGAGANGNTLTVTVADPGIFPNQVRLDVASVITDSFFADAIENLSVDGTYIFDGVNGTPTVAGGFNLLGDGDERLVIESSLAADWIIDGDGAGSVTMDVDSMTFNGLESIDASRGVDAFDVVSTNSDLLIRSREGDDTFAVGNTGTGIVTVNAGLGIDSFDVTNSGGGVILDGDAGNDMFTYQDTGTGTGDIRGGDGDDFFEILNSGSSTLRVDGDGGVDTFDIDNAPGTAVTSVFGGDGDDFFNVLESGMGDLSLFGEVGDDTYSVRSIDPMIAFSIRDSVNAENDTLLALGTDGDDVFDIGPDGATFNGGFPFEVIGVETFDYDGLAGNDTFNVDTGDDFDGDLTLRGGDGDDIFNIINSGTGTLRLLGDTGNDTYNVNFRPGTDIQIEDSVGLENDRFFGFGTDGVDTFNLGLGIANVNGGIVTMTGIESVDYDALGADDVFNISDTQVTSVFRGNSGADEFNVTQSNGTADFFGGAGDDTFSVGNATGDNQFFGEGGADQFTVTNHAPRNSSGSMLVDGGSGRNQLVVNGYATSNIATVTDNRISGLSAVPIDYIAEGTFTVANDVGGITLNGSSENDAFNVNSFLSQHSLQMNGFDGNDRFTVQLQALGGISADGGEGSDLYQFAVGSADSRFLFASDSGTTGSDRLSLTLPQTDDNVRFSGNSFVVETDRVQFNDNLEALVINARGGDDTIDVDRVPVGFVRIIGGTGDDTVNVNNFTGINSMLVNLDDGNDFLNIQAGSVTGTITAFGGDGDDSFVTSRAAFSNAILDGEEGSDTYEVFILDRSKRLVVARDTGTVGTDELIIHGTALDDKLVLRSGIVITPNQDILTNANTEVTNLFTEGLDDIVSIFGLSSVETNLMTEEGEDLVFVHSTFGPAAEKVLNIDAGSGQDTAIVSGTQADTTTTLIGGLGDDAVTIGSTLAANNGSLDSIFGAVHVVGGAGNDRLYLNDVGRVASYNYDIGPTFVSNGGGFSNFFAGVTFDATTETFRLDATQFRNNINLTPSMDTAFALYGGGGFNTLNLEGDDSDGRSIIGENGGDGFFTFTDGTLDVFFSEFFLS